MDLKELEALGPIALEHWYYQSKALALKKFLCPVRFQSVLDIGSGSAFFSKYLLEHSSIETACCVDTNYSGPSDEVWHGKPIGYRKKITSTSADLILLMDVLEHIEDDVGLLKKYVALVQSGSTIAITVPAFQFMWSNHDTFLGHKRRYTHKQIVDLCSKAGLEIVDSGYFFAFIFPLAVITRLLTHYINPGLKTNSSQLRQHHTTVNFILKTLCKIELLVIGKNKLFGLSIIVIGKKS